MNWNSAYPAPAGPYYYGAADQQTTLGMGPLKPGHLGAPSFMDRRFSSTIQHRRISLLGLLGCVLGSWFVFTTVLYVRAMWLRYTYPWLSMGIAVYFLLFTFVLGVMAYSAWRDPLNRTDSRVLGLAFLLCLGAWVTSFLVGHFIFSHFTLAYYDLTNLNSYPQVDPVNTTGAQLMDAGIIDFKDGAKLDQRRSIGFKDDDMYCVAPVVMGDSQPTSLDFWAVGMNCCSGHSADFHCGEFRNPKVHQGLRVMNDEKRSFYRLAVQQAEAAYNIKASHPVLLYWLSDPIAEVEAYKDDSDKYFMAFSLGSFAVLLVLVVFSALALHLLGMS